MTPRGLVLSVAGLIGLLLAGPSVMAQTSRAETARSYMDRRGAWLKKGEFERALADLNRALELDPQLPGVWDNRARVWFSRGEFTRALADFDIEAECNRRLIHT